MRHTLKQLGVKAIVALSVGLGAWTSGEAQRLYWSGNAVGYFDYGYFNYKGVSAVSDTGLVVGTTRLNGRSRAFRWNGSVFEYLAVPSDNSESRANDISADGRIIVGWISGSGAVRWVDGQLAPLGLYSSSEATAVSANGRVVIVSGILWEDGNVVHPPLYAVDVSADGRIVAGEVYYNSCTLPARWIDRRNLEMLPFDCDFDPFGYPFYSLRVLSISGDGQWVLASRVSNAGGYTVLTRRGIIWSPTCPNSCVYYYEIARWPFGVSHDGSVIVGQGYVVEYDDYGYPTSSPAGFLHRRGWYGPREISQVYSSLLSDGSKLYPTAVSHNGRFIAGIGYNATSNRHEAFLLDTRLDGDVDGNGCVDDADLLQVLFAFGQSGSNPADVNGDGVVDDADLLEVLFNFGSGC